MVLETSVPHHRHWWLHQIPDKNIHFLQQAGEASTVFGQVQALKGGAHNLNAVLLEFSASFSAVCPPSCTMTPSGFSC